MQGTKSFSALVCGYGVPKDILKDASYHAYLTACMNWLFDHYRDARGIITMNGGPTDVYKPYRRTEAEEMKRWLDGKLAVMNKNGIRLPWRIMARPKSLSSVETLLNFKPFVKPGRDIVIFCEATRAARIRSLAKMIFGKRKITFVPVDFDGSRRRYEPVRTKQSERDFLALEQKAVRDPEALAEIRRFMKKKLALMRRYDAKTAHEKLPEILERLHREFKRK